MEKTLRLSGRQIKKIKEHNFGKAIEDVEDFIFEFDDFDEIKMIALIIHKKVI